VRVVGLVDVLEAQAVADLPIRMVLAAHGELATGYGMPAETPATLDVAVPVAQERDETSGESQFTDVRTHARPREIGRSGG
jgi:hypothetical protein